MWISAQWLGGKACGETMPENRHRVWAGKPVHTGWGGVDSGGLKRGVSPVTAGLLEVPPADQRAARTLGAHWSPEPGDTPQQHGEQDT